MIKRYKAPEERRKARTRARIRSRAQLPRLSVFRSNKYLYAQIIDDAKGVTLVAAKDADAKIAGQSIAEKALKLKVKSVVFDRGGYSYHGRVKILAESAREAGLKF